MTVSVVHTASSTTASSTTAVVPLSVTPLAGDVVIVALETSSTASVRSFTAGSGLGATWTRAYESGAASSPTHSWWIGTGATSSGNATFTLNLTRASSATIWLVRGLSATTVSASNIARASSGGLTGPAETAGLGQIALGQATFADSTGVWPATQTPTGAWTVGSPVASPDGYRAIYGHAIPASSATYQTTSTTPTGLTAISQVVIGDVAAATPVTVAAPVLATTTDVLNPTVNAVGPVTVAAPTLTTTTDVLNPTVSAAAAGVTVQHFALTSGAGSSGSPYTVNLPVTPLAGDVVVVGVGTTSTTLVRDVTTVTGLGAAWSEVLEVAASSRPTSSWWIGTGATASGNITITLSSARPTSTYVWLIRGLPSAAAVGNSVSSSGSVTALTGPSQTAGLGSIVLGMGAAQNTALTWPSSQSPSGAWTTSAVDTAAGDGGSRGAGYAIPSSSVAHQTSATLSTAAAVVITQVVIGSAAMTTVAAPTLATTTDLLDPTVVSAAVPVTVAAPLLTTVTDVLNPSIDMPGSTLSGGFGFGSALTSQAITLAAQTLSSGFGFGSSLASEVINLQRMSGGFSFGSRLIQTRDWGVDPRTGRPEFRVVIADRFGTRYTELGEATISPLACGVNVLDSWSFRIARSDPRAAQVQPVAREAQLWRGNVLLSKGPIGPGRAEGEFITFDVSDPRWYMWGGRRVIGRIPRLNLLYNGDFTEGLAGWTPTYDAGSAPEAPPLVEIIDDPYTDGGKALQITGQDKVQMTKNVVETSAVFVPNSASYLPGGEAAIQAVGTSITDGSTVHVVGHTANDGTGSGLTLSLNRAKAARATLLAQDPTLTFTLLPGLRSPNANDGSVAGRGYYEPISSSLAPNRRVEIFYDTLQTATGHRQYVRQYVTVSQPVEERMPLEVVFSGDMRIVEWIGAPKDGWAVKLILTKVGAPTVEVDEGNAQMEQADLLDEWASYSASVTVPADGLDYRIEVRLYPPAGTSVWTNCRLEPQEQLGFFGVDQALIVKALIEHAQDTSYGHGALGIGTRTPLTGVSRRKKYPLSEHMPIETAVEWFTSIAKGLDIDFDHLNNAVVTYYPKQGSTSDMALVHGGRASIVKAYKPLTSGVRDIASSVIVQGGGFTGSRPERYASDPAALGGTLLEAVITAEEETPLNELDEAATSALASMLRARPGWEVTLDPARTSDVLDRLHKGDVCRLVLPDEGVDGLYRMVLSNLDPETDILSLTLIEEG